MSHPMPAVATIRAVAAGSGGQTLVVSGEGSAATFYAGLHRMPASTLLEAVLTWMAGAYEEIVLFSGRGPHLPSLRINDIARLGSGRAAIYLRRAALAPEVAPRQEAAAAEDALTQFYGNIRNRQQRRALRASIAVAFDAANMKWNDRVPRMLDAIEEWCGVDHLGSPLQRVDARASVRRLVIVDAEFLIPDAVHWRDDINMSQAETGQVPVRLSRLPEHFAGTQTDFVLLARDETEAQSLQSGQLMTRRLGEDAERHGQLAMKWPGVPAVVWPGRDLAPAFRAHYPDSRPVAYEHFVSTPPASPTVLRTIPLAKLTAEVIFERLTEQIIGQDEAMHAIADTIVTNLATREPADQRPIASFLLAGPSGSGKTSTAKALARALFGDDPQHLHRINMDQCRTELELLGAPPEYQGFQESWRMTGNGLLTAPLVQHPHRPMVILIDELEKGFRPTFEMLFAILDTGEAIDKSANRKVSLRNVVLVATTNEAAAELGTLVASRGNWAEMLRQAKTVITTCGDSRWPDSFLGRFRDGVLPLCYPPREELLKTIRQKSVQTIERRHRVGSIDPKFLDLVCDTYHRGSGVRGIEDRVSQLLKAQLLAIREQICITIDASGRAIEGLEAGDTHEQSAARA